MIKILSFRLNNSDMYGERGRKEETYRERERHQRKKRAKLKLKLVIVRSQAPRTLVKQETRLMFQIDFVLIGFSHLINGRK